MPSYARAEFTRGEMLVRMYASDPAADGLFITGVLTTGIYCLPSCPARKPNAENVAFFPDEGAARAAGLRPCKRCRPDRFYAGEDPDHDRLASALAQARRDPAAVPDVPALAGLVGVGLSKLHALALRHAHATPGGLLHRARTDAARGLLARGEAGATEAAFAVGYESVSAFYERFKAATGMTPGAFAALGASPAATFVLDLPAGYRSDVALRALGRDAESPVERVRGASAAKAYRLPSGPAVVHVEVEGARARCAIGGLPAPSPADAVAAHFVAVNVLGLGADPARFEATAAGTRIEPAVRTRRGLRVPRTADAWEAAVWAVVGQQVGLPFAFALRRGLAERYGERVGGMVAHPTAEAVAALDVSDLLRLRFSRPKAEYLVGLARCVATGDLPLEALRHGTATEAERRLLAVRGIGPWSAGYVLLRGLGFGDAVPLGDAGLAAAVERLAGLPRRATAEEQRAWLAPFAPDRGLAVYHLWEALQGGAPGF